MRKASEFRRHAKECRVLARNADRPEQRAQLIQMADTWEQIADERERLIARHPELSTGAERDEARATKGESSTREGISGSDC
jgi:hypothetical protein